MLLRIDRLHTEFHTPDGVVPAVVGVSLELDRGQTLALVGESGCGKTVTALSTLRLLPAPAGRIVGGSVTLDGHNLLTLSDKHMRAVRGNHIAMIFQEPMSSLNPVLSVGTQIEETLRLHRGLRGRAARARTTELLRLVGIPAPEQRRRQYPHELSGGMCQRVMIALALACEPDLLIADEPTTALDVTIQAQILDLLRELQRRTGMAILFITHDLAVVAEIADVVCVMYAGRIVERAPAGRLLSDPLHPYTRGLLRCTPRITLPSSESAARGSGRLTVIPGEVPDPRRRPSGCAFHPRCQFGRDDPVCQTQEPELETVAEEHGCACWKAGQAEPDQDAGDRAG